MSRRKIEDFKNERMARAEALLREALRYADSIERLRRLVARLNPEQYVTVRVDDLTALLRQAER